MTRECASLSQTREVPETVFRETGTRVSTIGSRDRQGPAPFALRDSPSPGVRSGDRLPPPVRAIRALQASFPEPDGRDKRRWKAAARGVASPPPAPTSMQTLA